MREQTVVGLTTAVGFALKGHKVIGIDIDKEKVNQINQKVCPTYEPGLAKAIEQTKIVATIDHGAALDTDISFLCGGTPGKKDGSIDLHYVATPARQLADVLSNKKEQHLVVVRSTVVPLDTSCLIMFHIINRLCGSRPVVGSSRNRIGGEAIKLTARSRRRRIPPE